ncbi:auxilin-related protein 2 isoform X2 [Vigna radiata var. radiata]|uniref:Auxilin-related protein 2 isoform X2 n=1 Tax=Vigna radiata var. radiata TaxID=3916 RepID=A0A1S3U4N2_VIGRR|nr:auxilin-related protein 2 isoform X2 [Vigna radiata var. radiata]
MNDFDGLLTNDFGFKPQGKSAPMAASKASSNNSSSLNFDLGSRSARASNSLAGHDSVNAASFHDLFSGGGKSDASYDFDSMFRGSADFRSKSVNLPAHDKPVYDKPMHDDDDDDIFDGVPGLKSSSKFSYGDVFATAAFDDLLGGLGKSKPSEKEERGVADFDDLIPGFGNSKVSTDGTVPNIDLSSQPTINSSKTASSETYDPFKVFEPTSAPMDASSTYFTDPLGEISKFSSSRSTKNDSMSNSNGEVYDDINPFGGLGNSVPAFSAERNSTKGSSSPNTTSDKESSGVSSVRSPERQTQNTILFDNDQEFHQAAFDMPTYSSNSSKPYGERSPSHDNDGFKPANAQADMTPKYEEDFESNDDVWLTVSEIPLFTQPTAAPPPSRPPPPRPVHILKSGGGSSASANVRKDSEFSSFPSSTQFSQGPKSTPAAAKFSSAFQFDELEDFAMGRSLGNDNEHGNGLAGKELEMNSAAAAMKVAMDKAEAKFRHAKEVRERENTKAVKSKEPVQLEQDGRAVTEDGGKQERLDHDWEQKQREEREERRREKEMEEKEREQQRLEREREMARQAVERATREARERAAVEARQRAERAAVGRANAEARKRAERAAVQRVQAEARERAAAEAKERAEKTAAEAKEREVREQAAAARAESEARVKQERAAVERAAAEARERAAVQARERAAAAVRMNQQQNDNDLESFFSKGARANSVPRPPRSSTSDPVFDAQFQSKTSGVSSSMKKASSSTNIVDDLSSIFGAAPSSSGAFQEVEGESEERRKARLERQQRAQDRAAKALAEKNQRDLQTQREQAEKHRLGETLDFEIKRWAAGKEGNLRALLSTLQYVLWPECGWQPVSLTDLITAAAVRKVYRKATLCIHPDKVQQKGATIQQKCIAEKVFDLLKEAWNKFNSEELF